TVLHDHEVGRDDNRRVALLDDRGHHVTAVALRRHLAALPVDLGHPLEGEVWIIVAEEVLRMGVFRLVVAVPEMAEALCAPMVRWPDGVDQAGASREISWRSATAFFRILAQRLSRAGRVGPVAPLAARTASSGART